MIKNTKNIKSIFFDQDRLWIRILICMILGISVGLSISPNGLALVSKDYAQLIAGWFVLPGHIFLALIQMVMLPLITSSIVLGIANSGSKKNLKIMGLYIAPYFLITTTVAVIIGVAVVLLINPGQYIDAQTLSNLMSENNNYDASQIQTLKNSSIHDKIVALIPANPLNAALKESMLQIVIFSIFIGIALLSAGPKYSKILIDIAISVQKISIIIVEWTMVIAPLAVFGLLTQITMQVGITAIAGISVYMGTVLFGLLLLLMFYLLLALIFRGTNPITFLSHLRAVQLLAFSTSSSAAVMPLSIKTAEEKMNVRPATANFIIPIGATVNMDGTALYQVVASMFLIQIFGMDISLGETLLLITTIIGASIGSPSTPGVGIVILTTILVNMGIPASGIALIIGVDRILDMSRTAINVSGDLTACVIMDKIAQKKLSS